MQTLRVSVKLQTSIQISRAVISAAICKCWVVLVGAPAIGRRPPSAPRARAVPEMPRAIFRSICRCRGPLTSKSRRRYCGPPSERPTAGCKYDMGYGQILCSCQSQKSNSKQYILIIKEEYLQLQGKSHCLVQASKSTCDPVRLGYVIS